MAVIKFFRAKTLPSPLDSTHDGIWYLKPNGLIPFNIVMVKDSNPYYLRAPNLQSVTGEGAITTAILTTNGFIKSGGTSRQFLMADGSLDTFGTAANTVAEGNDSRILNGQTAFGWGNHAGLYTLDSQTVKINGDQSISGQKTFNDNMLINGGSTHLLGARASITNHLRLFKNYATYTSGVSVVLGKLQVIIPIVATTMWSVEIDIIEYDGSNTTNRKSTTLKITGYTTNNSNRSVICDNPDRISQVEFGRTVDGNTILLINSPNNSWNYPKATISNFYTHYSWSNEILNKSRYGITISEDETNVASIQGTITNAQFLRDSFYLNASNLSSGTLPAARLSGNYTIGVLGNASTATTLQTARTINGVSFNGSANITVADATKLPLAGGTLTGALTLSSLGVNSSIISNSRTPIWSGLSAFSGHGISYFQGTAGATSSLNTIGFHFGTATAFGSIFNIIDTYGIEVKGNVYATADVIAFSDRSVKDNIRPIENVIERVSKSRGVLYDRTDIESKDNIGFIAQELEEQFPELVVSNGDGTKSVKYQNAVAVLFEAVKEQQKQLDFQKSQIETIMSKLNLV